MVTVVKSISSEDNKLFFTLTSNRSLTESEASQALAKQIVHHMSTYITNQPRELFAYSIQVIEHHESLIEELRKPIPKTLDKKSNALVYPLHRLHCWVTRVVLTFIGGKHENKQTNSCT